MIGCLTKDYNERFSIDTIIAKMSKQLLKQLNKYYIDNTKLKKEIDFYKEKAKAIELSMTK